MDAGIHATAIVLARPGRPFGLLLTGPSGAGKSSLALALIDEWQAAGRFARLVCDDRTVLRARHGRLIARPPAALAGLIEVRGLGPVARAHLPAACIHAHVHVREPVERLPDPTTSTFEGIALPRIDADSSALVRSWLREVP